MKIDLLKIVAFILIVLGFLALLFSGTGITGNVVGFAFKEINYVGFLIGFALLVSGALVLAVETAGDGEVRGRQEISDIVESDEESERHEGFDVIDQSDGRSKEYDRVYAIIDIDGVFGLPGQYIPLGMFRKEIGMTDDEELFDMYREELGPGLLRKYHSGDEVKKRVSEKFLEILGYDSSDLEERREDRYEIPKAERERIKTVFNGYEGGRSISADQRRVFEKYGFRIGHGGNHGNHIENEETSVKMPLQDSLGGIGGNRRLKNFIRSLIKTIEKSEGVKKRKKD